MAMDTYWQYYAQGQHTSGLAAPKPFVEADTQSKLESIFKSTAGFISSLADTYGSIKYNPKIAKTVTTEPSGPAQFDWFLPGAGMGTSLRNVMPLIVIGGLIIGAVLLLRK